MFGTMSIGQLVDEGGATIQTGPFGTQLKASDYVEEGIPVINVRNIGYSNLRPEKLEYVTEATSERLSVHVLAEDDIVFGRKGAVDRHLFVTADQAGWVQGSDCIRLRLTAQDINPRFVSYAFLRSYHKEWMLGQCGNKATMASLNQDVIRRIELPFPRKDQQDEIVSILSAYDHLIEKNRQRIELLEQAARLLYREWFVFLRFPGHEHVEIIEGVPEGWERRTLGSIAQTNCKSYGAKELPEQIQYIDISSIDRGRVVSRTQMSAAVAPGRARRKVQDGDIIWSNVRPNLRAYALILEPADDEVFSTGFTVLTARAVPYTWLYQFVTTENFVRHLVNHATGAGYPAVRPADFERAVAVVPSETLLKLFHEATEPSMRMISKLTTQSEKLAQARDLLLPPLMNREIAV
ncbi:restriction endonuclease subunit S, partial [Bradyrhizobium liaoningense]|uniref:restriction endonuclease subunit S n=1 Tax=Bradyrhizobium liaoningense TaxID=43992 RepID=UPI0004B1FB96